VIEDLSISANTIEKNTCSDLTGAGDKIVMSASSAGDLTASGTFTYSAATPAAVGFTPMGAWSSEATYARNDIAEKDGIRISRFRTPTRTTILRPKQRLDGARRPWASW
jgi:hypothetical protein